MENCEQHPSKSEKKYTTRRNDDGEKQRYLLHAELVFYYNKTNKIIVKNIDQLPNGRHWHYIERNDENGP